MAATLKLMLTNQPDKEFHFDEKVFANTPTNNKGKKIFYTLFAQHVSTLTWVLFRCSFTTHFGSQCFSFDFVTDDPV
jgi:hypothetical protein